MSAEVAEILAADDARFMTNWRAMSDEQRSAIGTLGFDRYRKLTPEVGKSTHRAERGAAKLDAEITKEKAKGPRFPRVWLDDALANVDADYIIKGLVERGRLNVIFGPAGDGKTFWTLDLAGHIAAGISWRGRRVRLGLVVYVAAEAGASILRRFSAWRDHHLSESREARAPLAIITRATNLLNVVEVEELLEELRAISDEAGLPLALVIFDTLSRSIAGGDENSAEDMTLVIGAADAIRDQLGAAVAIVHHSGKDATKGARGHSSLFAAADCVVSVIERTATVDKSRDGTQGDVFPFALDVVDLGTDSDGDACTTCIVRHLDGEAAAGTSKRKKITASAQVALDALKAALDASGEMTPTTSILPRVRAVTVDKWQDCYSRIRPIPQDLAPDEAKRERNARRMAFRRAQDELQAVRVAGTEAGFWWLIGVRT